MEESAECDQAAVLSGIRGLIESVSGGDHGGQQQQQSPAIISESVAQLIAAALNQVSQSIVLTAQAGDQQKEQMENLEQNGVSKQGGGPDDSTTPQVTELAQQVEVQTVPCSVADNVESIVEIASSSRRKPICVKFPTELRKRIIDLRKEGRKYKDIAKDLGVSVSGVQKVWERFLATGMIHDRKPSTYAGRPRKFSLYSSEEDTPVVVSPIYLTAGTGEGETETTYTTTDLAAPSQAVLVPSHDGEVFHEQPMDAPGAMVEVVASTTPANISMTSLDQKRSSGKKTSTPDYRKTLLLRLIENCPLATLMARSDLDTNPHVINVASSVARPLYMECVLGHPFGKVPPPRPFDGSVEESQVILSDPCNPVGKDLLAALGYNTKVHFNACCKPSPLFDPQKVLTKLPFSIGPGHLAETLQAVLQMLLDLCLDPVAALELIPHGSGPLLVAQTSDGELSTHNINAPTKLSDYWIQLYEYSTLLQCCENFFSATQPSAPCLICHPFESFAHNLQIKDPSPPHSPVPSQDISQDTPPTSRMIALNLTHSTSRTRPRKQSLSTVHHVEQSDSQQNYTLLHTTQANKTPQSLASGSSDSSTVVSTANIIPVTLVLCTDNKATSMSENCEITSGQTSEGVEVRTQSDGDLGVDGIQYVAYSMTEQERTSVEVDLQMDRQEMTSFVGGNVEVVGDVHVGREEEVEECPPSLNTRSRRKRQSSSRLESPRAKKSRKKTKEVDGGNEPVIAKHPQEWNVEDVAEFVMGVVSCEQTATLFREHEVNGESLLNMDAEAMVKLMNLKAGPAVRICRKLQTLIKELGTY